MARPQPILMPRRLHRGHLPAAPGGVQAQSPEARTGLEPSGEARVDPAKTGATGATPSSASVSARAPATPAAPPARAAQETRSAGAVPQGPQSGSPSPDGIQASARPAPSGPPEKLTGPLPLLAHIPDVQFLVNALRRWPEPVPQEPAGLEPTALPRRHDAGDDQTELIPALAAPADNSGIDQVLLDKIESVLRHASRVLASSADLDDSNRLETDVTDRFDVSELAPLLAPAGMLKGVRVYVQRVGGTPSLVIAPREDAPTAPPLEASGAPAGGPAGPTSAPALEASGAPAAGPAGPTSAPAPQTAEAATPSTAAPRSSARSLLRNILLKGVQDG